MPSTVDLKDGNGVLSSTSSCVSGRKTTRVLARGGVQPQQAVRHGSVVLAEPRGRARRARRVRAAPGVAALPGRRRRARGVKGARAACAARFFFLAPVSFVHVRALVLLASPGRARLFVPHATHAHNTPTQRTRSTCRRAWASRSRRATTRPTATCSCGGGQTPVKRRRRSRSTGPRCAARCSTSLCSRTRSAGGARRSPCATARCCGRSACCSSSASCRLR